MDPAALDILIQHDINTANKWYRDNGMIANRNKHQAIFLGRTDHEFSFRLKNLIDLLGVTVDNKLSFDQHISAICKKINNLFNVLVRFSRLISSRTTLRLYKAFILRHFHYRSSVWHFFSSRNLNKVETLTKGILRFSLHHKDSPYCQLLDKAETVSLSG